MYAPLVPGTLSRFSFYNFYHSCKGVATSQVVVSAGVHGFPVRDGVWGVEVWRVGARWGWVDSQVPYLVLLRVAYTLNGFYSAPRILVPFNAQISGLRKQ